MKKSFHLQDELQNTFQNLLSQLPELLRNDASTQKIILVYLKLGGEKLANYAVDIIKKRFRIEGLVHGEEAQRADSSTDEDFDMTEPHPHELGGFEFPVE